jgi:hypothetical protein
MSVDDATSSTLYDIELREKARFRGDTVTKLTKTSSFLERTRLARRSQTPQDCHTRNPPSSPFSKHSDVRPGPGAEGQREKEAPRSILGA